MPWVGLTWTLAVLASASLGTLAVVASVQGADALSTVALALAILSFSAQLVVTLAQAQGGAQQVTAFERVSTSTQGALTEIRATSDALLANQREQFSEVLRYAFSSAATVAGTVADREAAEEGEESEHVEAARRVQQELLLRAATGPGGLVRTPATEEGRRIHALLSSYPSEAEGRDSLDAVLSLGPWQAGQLVKWALRERERLADGGSREGWTSRKALLERRAIRSLLEAGLIEEVAPGTEYRLRPPDEWARTRLSDRGIQLARVLVPQGKMPVWILEALDQSLGGRS